MKDAIPSSFSLLICGQAFTYQSQKSEARETCSGFNDVLFPNITNGSCQTLSFTQNSYSFNAFSIQRDSNTGLAQFIAWPSINCTGIGSVVSSMPFVPYRVARDGINVTITANNYNVHAMQIDPDTWYCIFDGKYPDCLRENATGITNVPFASSTLSPVEIALITLTVLFFVAIIILSVALVASKKRSDIRQCLETR